MANADTYLKCLQEWNACPAKGLGEISAHFK